MTKAVGCVFDYFDAVLENGGQHCKIGHTQ